MKIDMMCLSGKINVDTVPWRKRVSPSHAKFPILPWEQVRHATGVRTLGVCFSIVDPTQARIATFLHDSFGGRPTGEGAHLIFHQAWKTYQDAFGSILPVARPRYGATFNVSVVGLFRPFFANHATGLTGKALEDMRSGTWYGILVDDHRLEDFIAFESDIRKFV